MRIIDADAVIDMSMPVLCGGGYEEMAVLVENIEAAPTIKTKQIKYYDEDENVWKIGEVIVSDSGKPNNCDTCRFELYCPEMCEGCCEWDSHYEPKDESQTEREGE